LKKLKHFNNISITPEDFKHRSYRKWLILGEFAEFLKMFKGGVVNISKIKNRLEIIDERDLMLLRGYDEGDLLDTDLDENIKMGDRGDKPYLKSKLQNVEQIKSEQGGRQNEIESINNVMVDLYDNGG
jgi:hypothetical protein